MSKRGWNVEAIIQKQLQVTGGAGKLIAVQPDVKPARESKYGNKKTECDGILFDSKKEAERYQVLKIEARVGTIQNLELQKRFDIVIGGMKVCTYIPDFVYIRDGKQVVEDVKSPSTKKKEVYRLKNKLMKAVFGINIIEV